MSLAAGIAVRVEDHRDNDPVTRVEPHGSAACEGSHLARQLQRTAHVQNEADAISHVLEVLEEPRRPASCSTARPHSYLALRTEFGASAQIRGLAREGRESAARRAWKFERTLIRTFKGSPGRRCVVSKRNDSRVCCRYGCRCQICCLSARP